MTRQSTEPNNSQPKSFEPIKGGVWHPATTAATFEDFAASLLFQSAAGETPIAVSIPFEDGTYAEIELLIASLTFYQVESTAETKVWYFIAPIKARPYGWSHRLFDEVHCIKGIIWFDEWTMRRKGHYNIHWQPLPIDWDAHL